MKITYQIQIKHHNIYTLTCIHTFISISASIWLHVHVWSSLANYVPLQNMKATCPAEILSSALLTRESIASETFIWFLISSPTVNGRLGFPWPEPEPEPDPGLFLEPEPGDFNPNAFLTLLAAVEVKDRWKAGELCELGELWLGESDWLEDELETKLRAFPEDVRHAATKIS